MLIFGLVLVAVLGYLVWFQNSSPDTADNAAPSVKTTASATSCQTSNLTATLTNGTGTAGTYYYTLTLTNKGTTSCTVTGSPTITALDTDGKTVGTTTPAAHTATAITIAAGAKAYSSIGFPNNGNFDSGVCKAMKSLVIYPPSQTDGLTIANIDSYNSTFTGMYCQALTITDFSDKQ